MAKIRFPQYIVSVLCVSVVGFLFFITTETQRARSLHRESESNAQVEGQGSIPSVQPQCPLCLCGRVPFLLHHGDTESTEVAQRESESNTQGQRPKTFPRSQSIHPAPAVYLSSSKIFQFRQNGN